MIIQKNKKTIPFEGVSLGNVFCYEGEFFIKTETTNDEDGNINCVDLESGSFFYVEPYINVEVVNAILNIE